VTAILLGYEDLESARSFFLEALGFDDEWEVRTDEGALTRSHVRFGDAVLMLDKPGAHDGVGNEWAVAVRTGSSRLSAVVAMHRNGPLGS
jgi:hypothetical protein